MAAFGVASALAWIVESPIIMMLSASNALCRDRIAYHKLRRFSFTLNGVVTAVMFALITPPVFSVVVRGIIGLPPDVAVLAGRSIIFLALWPAAIGFRRFYQGILIRNGRPQAVTWGTVIRLSTMTVTGLLLALVAHLPRRQRRGGGHGRGCSGRGRGELGHGPGLDPGPSPPARRSLRVRPRPDDRADPPFLRPPWR